MMTNNVTIMPALLGAARYCVFQKRGNAEHEQDEDAPATLVASCPLTDCGMFGPSPGK